MKMICDLGEKGHVMGIVLYVWNLSSKILIFYLPIMVIKPVRISFFIYLYLILKIIFF